MVSDERLFSAWRHIALVIVVIDMWAAVQYNSQELELLNDIQATLQLGLLGFSNSRDEQSAIRHACPNRRVGQRKQRRGIHNDPVKQWANPFHQSIECSR